MDQADLGRPPATNLADPFRDRTGGQHTLARLELGPVWAVRWQMREPDPKADEFRLEVTVVLVQPIRIDEPWRVLRRLCADGREQGVFISQAFTYRSRRGRREDSDLLDGVILEQSVEIPEGDVAIDATGRQCLSIR